ncbi:ATPase [archaeon]|nr:ATPase [archaeon]
MGKVVIGQENAINELLMAILCDGHVLVEGVPGIAKTLIIKALSRVIGAGSQRIQFTADLLPTDIIGVSTYEKSSGFKIIKGPIFTHFVLADEINRASPKVQAALLEAMQERQVTIFKDTHALPKPFFVMATQNPLESLGVYPLPQAQIDRFIFKVIMDYPNSKNEQKILMNNVTIRDFDTYGIKPVASPDDILKMQELVKKVYLNERMERYIVNIIDKTRNAGDEDLGRFVQWGASPRGSISLYIASKAAALLEGSDYVKPQHIKRVLHQVLRHRIILTYEGQAEDINTDDVIDQLISKVSVP